MLCVGYPVDFTTIGPYSSADLLKRYLRLLPTPLIPLDAFVRLNESISEFFRFKFHFVFKENLPIMKKREESRDHFLLSDVDKQLQLQQLKEMIFSLPTPHAHLLEYIVLFCVYAQSTQFQLCLHIIIVFLLSLTFIIPYSFSKIVNHKKWNGMSTEELATVMAPVFMPYLTNTSHQRNSLKQNGVIKQTEENSTQLSHLDNIDTGFLITRLMIENYSTLFTNVILTHSHSHIHSHI
jgi:hypothetical protein